MPKLKVLSAKDIFAILASFGFTVESQKGSHVKFKRMIVGLKQTLTVPNHPELDKGSV
ncbi:MAG TPA: type II toxin-antitoxin system HicA family toxin [Candidatus Paceibacterota bacterium]